MIKAKVLGSAMMKNASLENLLSENLSVEQRGPWEPIEKYWKKLLS